MADRSSSWYCLICSVGISSKKLPIYALGACDHLICYVCFTRQRVICKKQECPICRTEVPKIVFTKDRNAKFASYGDLSGCVAYNDFGIYFTDDDGARAYDELLQHRCRLCPPDSGPPGGPPDRDSVTRRLFRSVHDLKTHLRKEHDRFLCELCVNHLDLFTHERKTYSRKDLSFHEKTGDKDDKSYRGHPLCTFCDLRFIDDEELHKHLRRDHYFCHFCDPSGSHKFYANYDKLRDHFKSEHFLCEEGDCYEEKFTSVFKTEIDLQAHRASRHLQNASKAEAKEARRLNLELFIGPSRPGVSMVNIDTEMQRKKKERRQDQGGGGSGMGPNGRPLNRYDFLQNNIQAGLVAGAAAAHNFPRTEDFPSLVASTADMTISNGTHPALVPSNLKPNLSTTSKKSAVAPKPSGNRTGFSLVLGGSQTERLKSNDEFPSLCPGRSPTPTQARPSSHMASYAMSSTTSRDLKNGKANGISNGSSIEISKKALPQKTLTQLLSQSEAFPSLPENNYKKKKIVVPVSIPFESNKKIVTMPRDDAPNAAAKTQLAFKGTTKSEFPSLGATALPSVRPQHGMNPSSNGSSSKASSSANSNSVSTGHGKSSLSAIGGILLNSGDTNGASSVATVSKPKAKKTREYVEPRDFERRNIALVDRVKDVLVSERRFNDFRDLSRSYRTEELIADEYYRKCVDLFGPTHLNAVFPELIALLPDIKKQNSLIAAMEKSLKASKGAIPKKKNGGGIGVGSSGEFFIIKSQAAHGLIVCPTCNQVLLQRDGAEHVSAHR